MACPCSLHRMVRRMTTKKIKLELVGLDGNALVLMGAFSRQARKEGWAKDEIEAVMTECKRGDYDNLLRTLMAHCDSPD